MSAEGLGNAALLALVAIVPLVVLMLTSFVKISVVLALLRNAIGASDAPSGLVVLGLSLVLTFFVMAPVGVDMVRAANSQGAQDPPPGPRGAQSPVPGGPTAPAGGRDPAETSASRDVSAGTPAGGSASAGMPAGGSASAGTPAGGSDSAETSASSGASAGTPAGGSDSAETSASSGASAGTPAGGSGSAGTPADLDPNAPPPRPLDLDGVVRELVPAKYAPQVDAAARAIGPLKGFLVRHADGRDRETFTGLAIRMGRAANGDELWVLAPAFLTTELREAFAIAVLIFIPFLVIDLVVGLALAALGLVTTQPQTIALPLKLLLFVAVDGWRLLIDALLRGYA